MLCYITELSKSGAILTDKDNFISFNSVVKSVQESKCVVFQKLTNTNRFFEPKIVLNVKSSPLSRYTHSIKDLALDLKKNDFDGYRNILFARNREDVKIVAITNSSTKALAEYDTYKPDAVILDLELTDGEGSGFAFIEEMKNLPKDKMPKIVVTTNVHSNTVYDYCHSNNIEFIFYKKQKNYLEKQSKRYTRRAEKWHPYKKEETPF